MQHVDPKTGTQTPLTAAEMKTVAFVVNNPAIRVRLLTHLETVRLLALAGF